MKNKEKEEEEEKWRFELGNEFKKSVREEKITKWGGE